MSAHAAQHAVHEDTAAASSPAPVAATLEPLSLAHASAMLRWMHDPAVTEPLGIRGAPSLERTLHWLEDAIAERHVMARAIVLEGRHVGNVVLDQIDPVSRSARLSLYIGEAAVRGRGVGGWAVREAVRLGFDERRLERVWLTVRRDNVAAVRAYRRAGFSSEQIADASACAADELLLMTRHAR